MPPALSDKIRGCFSVGDLCQFPVLPSVGSVLGCQVMNNQFFEHPILNSPYDYPNRHWELDAGGQPTQQIIESRRRAEFITPIPKPRKRKGAAEQSPLLFDEGKGLSTGAQQYDHTAIINGVRQEVDKWRKIPDFEQKVEAEFNKMIALILNQTATIETHGKEQQT